VSRHEHMFDPIHEGSSLPDVLSPMRRLVKDKGAESNAMPAHGPAEDTKQKTLDPGHQLQLADNFADDLEPRLPRRGRRPVAWIQDAGFDSMHNEPYADVAVTDWDAAAAVAAALWEETKLTRHDWLFHWRRAANAFRVIRVYPSSAAQ
jgi:hypothetical protein